MIRPESQIVPVDEKTSGTIAQPATDGPKALQASQKVDDHDEQPDDRPAADQRDRIGPPDERPADTRAARAGCPCGACPG